MTADEEEALRKLAEEWKAAAEACREAHGLDRASVKLEEEHVPINWGALILANRAAATHWARACALDACADALLHIITEV